MPYAASFALQDWQGKRHAAIKTVEEAHAHAGEIDGPGPPLGIGRPLAHAYVVHEVAEFQAFCRDLHDLLVELTVKGAQVPQPYAGLITRAAKEGRGLDRGNAGIKVLQADFRRLGIQGLNGQIAGRNKSWPKKQGSKRRGDKAYFEDLIELRNAIAHGNQAELRDLRKRGVPDTLTWARARLPGLDRTARAMDRIVWEHLKGTFGADPW